MHDISAYIMAPARRDGAGWGRALIPRMDLLVIVVHRGRFLVIEKSRLAAAVAAGCAAHAGKAPMHSSR